MKRVKNAGAVETAMTAQTGRGNTLQECSPPQALNAEESDDRLRTPRPSLWISSSVPGTKNRHVVFFSINKKFEVLQDIAETYSLPYLQVYYYDERAYCLCLKTVTKERFEKILKGVSRKSLAEFKKYGHIMHPLLAIPAFQIVNPGKPHDTSRAHYVMMKRAFPLPTILVGNEPEHVFRRVTRG